MQRTDLLALLVAGLAAAPIPAQAEWQQQSFDNGSWFEAWVGSPGGALTLHCGGPSPTGQPLPQSDEPLLTDPYTLHLGISTDITGEPTEAQMMAPMQGAMIVAGENGFVLPGPTFDMMSGVVWVQPLGFGDPLVAALIGGAGGRLEVHTPGRPPVAFDPAGLAAAISQTLAFCDARWAALGQPVPPQAVGVVNALRAAAAPP